MYYIVHNGSRIIGFGQTWAANIEDIHFEGLEVEVCTRALYEKVVNNDSTPVSWGYLWDGIACAKDETPVI